MPARLRASVALALTALVLAACNPDTVTLAYRPTVGATFRYVSTVTTSTTTALDGEAPTTETSVVVLEAEQQVLEVEAAAATRVRITLRRAGGSPRTYVARFDRAAQLTEIEQVEEIPAGALGDLGLTDIFPAAAGAPPDHPLRPGDRWTIDERVLLPAAAAAVSLTGRGRLVELGVIDGRPTAKVTSTTTLPLSTSTSTTAGVQQLDGTQTTSLDADYDVDDGSIVTASATTNGAYSITLAPPTGQRGDPISGRLTVEVTSVTRRT